MTYGRLFELAKSGLDRKCRHQAGLMSEFEKDFISGKDFVAFQKLLKEQQELAEIAAKHDLSEEIG